MAFVTGLMLIDAPASALNNAGSEEGARTDNTIAVKRIRTRVGDYPYVSAQAVRYWIRTLLERSAPEWQAAPVFREAKIAYTDANPILYWDDDLFGYMRAPSKRAGARSKEQEAQQTPRTGEITRISPLRTGTLVSLAPVRIVDDFGTMARQNGDPVPHEHQFYRTTLQGLFSLNLTTAGTFFNGGRVGYRNLDENRIKLAEEKRLAPVTLHGQPAFRLPYPERAKRVATLIRAFGDLEGGAKLSLHYTDVTPSLIITAVIRGGNHPFSRVVRANSQGGPEIVLDALKEVLRVYKDQILSDVFIGWPKGYLDEQREEVKSLKSIEAREPMSIVHQEVHEQQNVPEGEPQASTESSRAQVCFRWGHPREVMAALATELEKAENEGWYD
jgi:CRISPR-associated protein Cst2